MALTKDELELTVISTLDEMMVDWDMELADGIHAQSLLVGDLAFESIDIVQLAVSLEQAVNRKGLPYEKLFMKDGDYVEDVSVSQIVNFMHQELG